VTLTFDLEVVSESRVTWATYVPILVLLGLSVLDFGTMYATDRRQADRRNVYVRLYVSVRHSTENRPRIATTFISIFNHSHFRKVPQCNAFPE